MDMASKLGVQSYCYRGIKDLAGLIAAVKATGVDRIELCGVHTDFAQCDQHAGVVEQLRKGGIKIVSIGVNGISADEAKARPSFDFLRAAGTKHMSISLDINAQPACFRVAEKLAEEYDVQLGIHNHGGYDWLGSQAALAWVFKQTSPRIGLSLDTAWAMQTGRDPLGFVEQFGSRLSLLHIKDFIFDRAGRWQDVVAGTGNLDLTKLQAALDKVGFAGDAIIEYEGDVDNPVPALQACVKAVRSLKS
jgi:sugar phosphate isomerase/epimerase